MTGVFKFAGTNISPVAGPLSFHNLRLRQVSTALTLFSLIGTAGCALTAGKPGAGGSQVVSVTPNPVSFGSVTVGNQNTQMMQLTNAGTADLTVTALQASGAGFSVAGLSMPVTLAAGQTASFSSSFKPTAAGSATGSISITSDASGSPMSVSMSGTGTTSSVQLSASPTSVNFGSVNVGVTATQTVKLTNNGNTDVTITSAAVTGSGMAESGGMNVTLTAGQSTNVSVSFDPVAAGSVQGTLTVLSNAPTLQVGLSGQGTSQVQHTVDLSWSPSTSQVLGYNVYRGTVSGGPYGKVNAAIDSATSYLDQTVASGTTYYYVVTSVGTDNVESAPSGQVTAIIPST